MTRLNDVSPHEWDEAAEALRLEREYEAAKKAGEDALRELITAWVSRRQYQLLPMAAHALLEACEKRA